jgi:hypothetical protein
VAGSAASADYKRRGIGLLELVARREGACMEYFRHNETALDLELLQRSIATTREDGQ